uniref:SSD domain-containing protein n=1 Tax=Chrysemys picta bellii TaxID=8478 RepID=A0A8C3HSR0_CHRPI
QPTLSLSPSPPHPMLSGRSSVLPLLQLPLACSATLPSSQAPEPLLDAAQCSTTAAWESTWLPQQQAASRLGLASRTAAEQVGAPRQANDIEGQFTPLGGPAKSERRFAQEHFPTRDSERFSGQRLLTEGAFASLIAVSASGNNILTAGAFGELLRLDGAVQSLAVPGGDPGTQLSYPDLCVRSNGSCGSPNPLLAAVQGEPARLETLLPQLTYPVFGSSIFMGTFLGGVQLAGGAGASRVQAAKALRLVYYLREDEAADRERSLQWLENFLKRIPAELEVAYFTSISRQEEFEGNIRKVIPLFSITYFLTITFAITSCLRVDCVRNKVWVAAFGVLSSGLAVLSSFGLLLFCGVPFVLTVANAPFLILGVGVDDMFIMISSWQQTNPKNKVEKRMAETYAEAAVSITITTLTDVLAFYIGIMTSFQSVKSFYWQPTSLPLGHRKYCGRKQRRLEVGR